MKKIRGTVAAVFICLGMLSGCGNENVNEEIPATFSDTSVTFSETVSEISKAAETEMTTFTEISEENFTETNLTEETAPDTENTDSTRNRMWWEYETIDMSAYTGNFYEWEYDYDIVVHERESFAGGEDILAAAEEAIEDKNDLRFEEGVWEDFDGDGRKEGFLMFTCESEIYRARYCYVVFADADGGVHILKDSAGPNGNLNPMRYNGFIHMCTDFGVHIASTHMEIYAVEENSAVEKYDDFFRGEPLDGAFMIVDHFQGGGESIIFWNEQRREYCQLENDRITEEDINDILESEAFAGSSYDEMPTDELDKATIVRMSFFNYGGKYFCTASGYGYERRDGEIVRTDRKVTMLERECTRATGINIEKAKAEMVRLEK